MTANAKSACGILGTYGIVYCKIVYLLLSRHENLTDTLCCRCVSVILTGNPNGSSSAFYEDMDMGQGMMGGGGGGGSGRGGNFGGYN